MRYLEADYSQRMVDEHSGEQGMFGKVEPTMEIAAQSRARAQFDPLLANDMPSLIEDSSVMDELDKEIREITDSEANIKAKSKNLKSSENQQ